MLQNNDSFDQVSGEVIAAIYEMSKGSNMLMTEKLRRPHFRTFILSKDLKYLQWQAPKKSRGESFVLISQITQVLDGQKTDNFENCQIPEEYKPLSFCVIYSTEQGQESLNIISKDKKEYDVWLIGLRALISGMQDIELIEELINCDEDLDISVRSIVTTLEKNNKTETETETTNRGSIARGSKLSTVSLRRNTGSSDLYTWGDGSRSMLGHGEEIEEHRPRIVDALSTFSIKLVACGTYHTLCVTASGETLSWGAGSKGQLGQGHLRDRFTPLRVEALQQEVVVQISCNEYHSAAVTDEGKLYTWGYGSIKLGYETPANYKQLSPKVVESLTPYIVIHVSCGKDFTLACTCDGQVFAFGNNKFYQLGLGDNNPHCDPTLVEFENLEEDSIIQVACGQYHSAAISDGGNIWMWGTNEYGQLGTEDNFTMISKPCKLQIVKEDSSDAFVTDVSCGNRHTALVTFCGLVYCFGDNSYNQLGRKNQTDNASKCNRPEKTKFPSGVKIKKVSCGAYYSAAVSEYGEIFTWGNNSDGQLGHGDDALRLQPTQITECFEGKQVLSVSCGSSHSACTAAILPRGIGVRSCMGCHVKFSRLRSRYHCDRCEGTFCSSCAPKRPRRLCDKCFEIIADVSNS